jgi:VWFA-related protein
MGVQTAEALACAVAWSAAGAVQQPSPFKASVGLVVLEVTVHDEAGRAVTTLNRDAFSVFENGVRQPVTIFSKHDAPLSLGLLIDNSGSMRQLRPQAASTLVHASNPRDEVFVVNFADTPRIDVPLTTDPRAIETGIARVDPIGGTALRDAVDMAQTYLHEHGSNERKALVVISEGYDNASLVPLAHAQRPKVHEIPINASVAWSSRRTAHRHRRCLSPHSPTDTSHTKPIHRSCGRRTARDEIA